MEGLTMACGMRLTLRFQKPSAGSIQSAGDADRQPPLNPHPSRDMGRAKGRQARQSNCVGTQMGFRRGVGRPRAIGTAAVPALF